MTDQPSTTDQPPRTDQASMTDQSHRPGALLWIKCVILLLLLYPLSVGPVAFLHGAGVIDDKAVESIRPIYAPLMNVPGVWLLVGYEQKFDALGRRFHK
jgi:hypothetical protein